MSEIRRPAALTACGLMQNEECRMKNEQDMADGSANYAAATGSAGILPAGLGGLGGATRRLPAGRWRSQSLPRPRAPQRFSSIENNRHANRASQATPLRAGSWPALGLYVHVPFCATTCDFCAFYQEAPTAAQVRRYLDGVARELDLVDCGRRSPGAGVLSPHAANVDTVFWGGGTPGALAAKDLKKLGGLVRARFGGGTGKGGGKGGAGEGAAPREWTVELAPGSVSEARLEALREMGVTRISMGAQSFQPALLEALGRRHSPAQIYRAYERIRAAGFKNVNLDLMFALPGQDEAAWLRDLREAVALAPEHLSTYCLTFEEDTALWVKLSRGKVKLDSEREARLYERTWAELDAAGYPQYEISNFARPGFECLHNLNTWRMQEWIGVGPSAASQHAGWRGANPSDIDAWLTALARGERATEERVPLTPAQIAEDSLIFGLRMNEGVDLQALRAFEWHGLPARDFAANEPAGVSELSKPTGWQPVPLQTHGLAARATSSPRAEVCATEIPAQAWARVDELVERLVSEGLAERGCEGGEDDAPATGSAGFQPADGAKRRQITIRPTLLHGEQDAPATLPAGRRRSQPLARDSFAPATAGVTVNRARLRLTLKGRLVADAIGAEFLGALTSQ